MGLFKLRKDATLKTVAKTIGVSEEIFRNEDGRKKRNDTLLKNLPKADKKKK